MGFLLFSGKSAFLLPVLFCLSLFLSTTHVTALQGVKLKNQILDVTPINYVRDPLSKDDVLCERILITGLSRWRLSSYSSAYRVSLVPSAVIPDRLLGKLQICFHKNSSLGLCQCEHDAWKNFQKRPWKSVMSPYEDRILDVKLVGGLSGSVTVTVEEDLQRWRLLLLASGIMLVLMAPIVNSWVPFYYSSSMAIGVCLVLIVLLFQGMKLLPTGRRNIFYLTIYGSVLGAGSVLVHQFSMLINFIASNFGLGEEFHNPLTSHKLNGKNYLEWAQSVRLAIDGRGKLGHLTGETRKPEPGDPKMNAWRSENSMAITWLLNSMEPAIGQGLGEDDWQC